MTRKYGNILKKLSTMTPLRSERPLDAVRIQKRLTEGRKEFQEVVEKVMDAVIKISALDLSLEETSKEQNKISQELLEAARKMGEISGITNSNIKDVAFAHERMTENMAEVSSNSEHILEGIENNALHLTQVVEITTQTIDNSMEMKTDMEKLLHIIESMNGVISSINGISTQTNLLSLNATIEAARAGEAGRGFAIVAQEINKLAIETKELTTHMDEFMADIHSASQQSSESIDITVKSLGEINEKLTGVMKDNQDNKKNIGNIVEAISDTASSCEEINSAVLEVEGFINKMDDECAILNEQSENLQLISETIIGIIKPVSKIESNLDESMKTMGNMAKDAFYMLDNQIFTNSVQSAIIAHQKWVDNLQHIVQEGVMMPLQTNSEKCGFGHFYYSMKPKNEQVIQIWDSLEDKHNKLHNIGKETLSAMWDGQDKLAAGGVEKAKVISRDLIGEFDKILQIVQELEVKNCKVFE